MKKGQTILFLGLYFTLVLTGLFGILFGTQVSIDAEPTDHPSIMSIPESTVPLTGSFDTPASPSDDPIVYITNSSNRYHSYECHHLSGSKIETTLSVAHALRLTTCESCSPPG